MCYLSKCPYVPPHEWNVDFPHLMMRGKAIKYKKGESKVRDKVFSSTDLMGKTLAKPVISNVVNASNKNKLFRNLLDTAFKVHKHRDLPDYSAYTFRGKNNNTDNISDPISPSSVPSKVVLFTTCYVNYNEPIIGEDFLKILNKNNIYDFLNQKFKNKKKFATTDLFIGFFGYELLNNLIDIKLPKQKSLNFPKGIFYKPEKKFTLSNLSKNFFLPLSKISSLNPFFFSFSKIFRKISLQ